jgi:hypothetical protein
MTQLQKTDTANGEPTPCKKRGHPATLKAAWKPGQSRTKTGGRKKGTPNKATREVKDLAQQYAPDALKELARLAREAENESARVSAIKELLDRAYGKAPQAYCAGIKRTSCPRAMSSRAQ